MASAWAMSARAMARIPVTRSPSPDRLGFRIHAAVAISNAPTVQTKSSCRTSATPRAACTANSASPIDIVTMPTPMRIHMPPGLQPRSP